MLLVIVPHATISETNDARRHWSTALAGGLPRIACKTELLATTLITSAVFKVFDILLAWGILRVLLTMRVDDSRCWCAGVAPSSYSICAS